MVQTITTVAEDDSLRLEYLYIGITFVNCVLITHLTPLYQTP